MRESAAPRSLAARLVGGLILAVALYYGVWGGEYTAFDLRRLHQQKQEVDVRLADTRQQVDSLRRLADLLDKDAATIEQVARERFGMIREGELLYRFVEVSRPAATSAAGSAP